MSGFNPAFPSIVTGTLCGRWPDVGLWAVLVHVKDSAGVIDCTHEYLAMVTGLPVDEVRACMLRFRAPDPASRSRVEGGAKLVLIEPDREWGWRMVNHELYQRKAMERIQIVDGRNAAKVRRYKERKRLGANGASETPTDTDGHHGTPLDTEDTSQTQTQTQTHLIEDSEASHAPLDDAIRQDVVAARSTPRGTRCPVDNPSLIATPELMAWAREHAPDVKLTDALLEFCDYWRGVPGARGRKLDWPATFRNRLRELQGKRQQARAARGPVLLPVADG